MKLYIKINNLGQVTNMQEVEDYVFLQPPWMLQTAEYYAAWKSAQPIDIPHTPDNSIHSAISNADLRRGLIELGVNPALVTAYLNSLPESTYKWMAITDWEYSNYVERSHPMLDQLAPNFGLTPESIDAIFSSKPEFKIQ